MGKKTLWGSNEGKSLAVVTSAARASFQLIDALIGTHQPLDISGVKFPDSTPTPRSWAQTSRELTRAERRAADRERRKRLEDRR